MSANLLDGITPQLLNGTTESDGIYHHVARTDTRLHDDWLMYNLPEQPTLSANQIFHVGLSVKGASANSASLKATIGYQDAAGNHNYASSDPLPVDTSWGRSEGTIVVPSGMTPFGFYVAAYGTCPETWMASPTLCYGSTGIVMAVGSVTVASINDVASTTRWYLLQSSTLATPAAPTASPPGGSWQTTEPTYTEGSTNSLYFVDETIFSDGTWAYSSVSLSTSYEAAKAAYNKAAAASAAAATTAQHFWSDTDGAHVSSTGDHDTSGFHQLMTSVKNAFMHGTTELMTISENLIELGKNSTSSAIKMCGGIVQLAGQAYQNRTAAIISATTGPIILSSTVKDQSDEGSPTTKIILNDGIYDYAGYIGLYGRGLAINGVDTIIEMDAVSAALNSDFSKVHRAAGVISGSGSNVDHYTKIGTWSGTREAQILKIRVMTGHGFNGLATDNSWIDIFIKKSSTASGTTNAFGVSYELHNANSAALAPYVVATASDSCDIWVKNSWGWGAGWYIAEYAGQSGAGTWSDGGSVHQTSVPSGTLQSASCLGAAVYSGSKTFSGITTPDFNFLSNSEYTAITGHAPNKDFDTITVCSGDDSAYRGIMTASIQTSGNIIIRCDPAPNDWIRINYTITTS